MTPPPPQDPGLEDEELDAPAPGAQWAAVGIGAGALGCLVFLMAAPSQRNDSIGFIWFCLCPVSGVCSMVALVMGVRSRRWWSISLAVVGLCLTVGAALGGGLLAMSGFSY